MRELIKCIVPIKYRIWGYINKISDDGVIRSGFFEGMKFLPGVVGSVPRPKIMGTYERELAGIISDLSSKRYKKVIDVGAAEGYYAVGLAIKNPDMQVVAFEMQTAGQQLIKQNADLNHVSDRVLVKGVCTHETLKNEINHSSFIIMDVEGFENELLDPTACPELLKADILVEIHDFISEEIAVNVQKRFYKTHHIVEIKEEERTFDEFPIYLSPVQKLVYCLSLQNYKKAILNAMNEKRPMRMRWFYMTKKSENF